MTETTCPLCNKPLKNGACDDCGYYVDNYEMDNQKDSYFTEPYTIDERQEVIKEPEEKYENKAKEINTNGGFLFVKIFMIVFAFFVPVMGIILGVILISALKIKDNDSVNSFKKFGGVLIALSIIFMIAKSVIGIFL